MIESESGVRIAPISAMPRHLVHAWQNLGPGVHALLRSYGLHVAIMSTDRALPNSMCKSSYGIVQGVFAIEYRTLFLKNPSLSVHVFTHEIGHAIQDALDMGDALAPSILDTWPRGCAISRYGSTSPAEGFAEAFAAYVCCDPLPEALSASQLRAVDREAYRRILTLMIALNGRAFERTRLHRARCA